MKIISLASGEEALIDDCDYDAISAWRWQHCNGYAIRTISRSGKKSTLRMHRVITEAPTGMQVDHINGDGLDNRRSNLRICTGQQNIWNVGKSVNRPGTSGFVGVSFRSCQKFRPWVAQAYHLNKNHYIGSFKTETEAALAYDQFISELRGEFARFNFEVKRVS